jgi:FlaA1/EpsC-like NDP-sugar epimerase
MYNLLGTLSLVKCAIEHQVTSLVLISIDKTVRPTSIMGCTKRIAEMMLQALSEKKELEFESLGKCTILFTRKTHLSMVRFGNVLGSSGSVVPIFQKQIKEGGPITMTHQDITRYFMTIPEAAQLFMQAGAMAKDIDAAEVFVLDMGDPVRIFDLAKRMIELSSYRVKNEQNPNGDIEIQIIGLRPGEKLYEELLIGNNPRETEHPRIMKVHEHFISWEELQPQLRKLQLAAENGEIEKIRNLMKLLVTDYTPEKKRRRFSIFGTNKEIIWNKHEH